MKGIFLLCTYRNPSHVKQSSRFDVPKVLTLGNIQINLTSSNFNATHPIKNTFLLGFTAQKFDIYLA